MNMRRALTAAILGALLATVWVSAGSAAPRRQDAGTVTVLYAGSLVGVMEQQIGPAFAKATGYGYAGFGAGSTAVANQIKSKLKQGDVFISASPSVNNTLEGAANGNWVNWYGEFAAAPLVIGYSPNSKFASAFKTKPWWQVLPTPGLLLGRTDPLLDPKGKLTIQFINRASKTLGMPNLFADTLVTTANTAQIFPEETLLGRLEAGQLDAGFFYSIEAKAANIPFVAPPLGTHYGARYTITILNNGPNAQGALAFAEFLLGPQGTAILKQDGFQLLNDDEIGGTKSAVPAPLKPLLGAK
jgi:molybdate/tungstate transport system substrate-binding protein